MKNFIFRYKQQKRPSMNYNLQSQICYYFTQFHLFLIWSLLNISVVPSGGRKVKEKEELLQKFECSVKIGYILIVFYFNFF